MAFESLVDIREPARRLLDWLRRGDDVFEIALAVRHLHRKHDTFPGEVYLRVGAACLDAVGLTAADALEEEGLLDRFLPEASFRGRKQQHIRYALMAPAAWRGGLQVDLLSEVIYWDFERYWEYQLMAAVVYLRSCADRAGVPVDEFADRILAPFLT